MRINFDMSCLYYFLYYFDMLQIIDNIMNDNLHDMSFVCSDTQHIKTLYKKASSLLAGNFFEMIR